MVRANEAGWDRALRVLVGGVLVLLAWGAGFGAWAAALVAVAGIGLLVAGLLGWCPIYAALGVSTLRRSGAGDGES